MPVQVPSKRHIEDDIETVIASKRVAVGNDDGGSLNLLARMQLERMAEKRKAEEELKEANRKAEELKEANRKAEEDIAKRDVELKEAKRKVFESELKERKRVTKNSIREICSASKSTIYRNFIDKKPQTVSFTTALALYDNLTEKQLEMLESICARHKHPASTAEKSLVHRSMVCLLTEILMVVNTNSEHDLKLIENKAVGNALKPDVTITTCGVTEPHWTDAIGMFEFNRSESGENSKGRGQALNYLGHALLDLISDPRIGLAFSVFLNYDNYCIYTFKSETIEFFVTEDISLFDGKSLHFDAVKLLAGLLNDRFNKIRPRFAEIGTKSIPLIESYTIGREICCARANYVGEDVVIKYSSSTAPFRALKRLHDEARNIKVLQNISKLNCSEIVELFPNALILKPVGLSLEKAVEDMDPLALLRGFSEQLQVLHKADYVHADIRSLNLVVVGEKAFIIDWQTLCKPGLCQVDAGIFCLFTASDHILDESDISSLKFLHDFESLLYSFCYVLDYTNTRILRQSNTPTEADSFKALRNTYMRTLLESDQKVLRIISHLYSLICAPDLKDGFHDWPSLVDQAEKKYSLCKCLLLHDQID